MGQLGIILSLLMAPLALIWMEDRKAGIPSDYGIILVFLGILALLCGLAAAS